MNTASNQDIPRKVAANRGFQWVVAGFRMYRKNPLLLSAAFGVLFGMVMALGLIPVVGGSLSELASPLMVWLHGRLPRARRWQGARAAAVRPACRVPPFR